jgi:hypothetical protein
MLVSGIFVLPDKSLTNAGVRGQECPRHTESKAAGGGARHPLHRRKLNRNDKAFRLDLRPDTT